jgi:uncharacterized protein
MDWRFEWDPEKTRINEAKHGVAFEEASPSSPTPSPASSTIPTTPVPKLGRSFIGHSNTERLLVVCFTERADAIRLFSARKATRRERVDYEKGTR